MTRVIVLNRAFLRNPSVNGATVMTGEWTLGLIRDVLADDLKRLGSVRKQLGQRLAPVQRFHRIPTEDLIDSQGQLAVFSAFLFKHDQIVEDRAAVKILLLEIGAELDEVFKNRDVRGDDRIEVRGIAIIVQGGQIGTMVDQQLRDFQIAAGRSFVKRGPLEEV